MFRNRVSSCEDPDTTWSSHKDKIYLGGVGDVFSLHPSEAARVRGETRPPDLLFRGTGEQPARNSDTWKCFLFTWTEVRTEHSADWYKWVSSHDSEQYILIVMHVPNEINAIFPINVINDTQREIKRL